LFLVKVGRGNSNVIRFNGWVEWKALVIRY
jgi:hypothetical protein